MIQMFTKRLSNKNGFTLIELIVVIAILGVLVAIAAPRLASQRDNATTTANMATARTIMSAVTMAEAQDGELKTDTTETIKKTEDNINKYLDGIEVKVIVTAPTKNENGWEVIVTSPIEVYYNGEKVEIKK